MQDTSSDNLSNGRQVVGRLYLLAVFLFCRWQPLVSPWSHGDQVPLWSLSVRVTLNYEFTTYLSVVNWWLVFPWGTQKHPPRIHISGARDSLRYSDTYIADCECATGHVFKRQLVIASLYTTLRFGRFFLLNVASPSFLYQQWHPLCRPGRDFEHFGQQELQGLFQLQRRRWCPRNPDKR